MAHGDEEVAAKRFNLRDNQSRLLNLGWVHNETKGSTIAVSFVEYLRFGYSPQPWVLTAFSPRNVAYYDFIDEVPLTLKQNEQFVW